MRLKEEELWTAGWSHNPYARREDGHADAIASAIAKRYIALFDRALRERGYVVATAVEVEATLNTDANTIALFKSDGEAITQVMTYINDTIDASALGGKHQKKLEKVIEESGDDEIEITSLPSRPLATAARIAGLKQRLYEGTREGVAHVTGVAPSALRSRPAIGRILDDMPGFDPVARKALDDMKLHSVRFYDKAKHPAWPLTHGEHINLSIHAVADAPNQKISESLMAASPFMKSRKHRIGFLQHMKEYGVNDWLLLSSGAPSERRMRKRYFADTGEVLTMQTGQYSKEGANALAIKVEDAKFSYYRCLGSSAARKRFELRIPDAECNPYLSMLWAMAHVYAYVSAIDAKQAHASWLTVPPVTPQMLFRHMRNKHSEALFRSHGMVLPAMEAVAEELNVAGAQNDALQFEEAVIARHRELNAHQFSR